MANLCLGGTPAQILSLIQCNAIPVLCSLLNQTNIDMLANALGSLYIIFTTVAYSFPERLNEVRASVRENGGLILLARYIL